MTQNWQIEVKLKEILDFVVPKFNNIKEKGKSDWNQEAEDYVLIEVLKEGVNLYFQMRLMKALREKSDSYSTDQMLIANPSQFEKLFPDFNEENFGEKSMKELHEKTTLVVDDYLSKDYNTIDNIHKELLYLERDGRFERTYRNGREGKEKFFWIKFGQIKKEDFQG